ncbi:hypothetical protein ACLPJK_25805 [Pseudomonas aeruginosa]|uniref:hypothetical protein n=1 Tax=Pseudomonas aeruginosa TaxID=287 RepID=UPI003D286E22
MSDAYYEIFVKSGLRLIGTLVIKSETAADAINNRLLQLRQDVDLDNPSSWKYYCHLSGRYHPTDTPMQVISLDTREVIDFTTQNLGQHLATRDGYKYGSRYYNELVGKYPEQETLIKGILNPIDTNVAINARDHSILFYDTTLVEPQESDLIEKLQEFIDAFFIEFEVPDYHLYAPLYAVAMYGILFAMLPMALDNIRRGNARTDRAHTFHIHAYMPALRPYFDYMTLKQKLFFYRNINYINRNNGKVDIFQWLTEKVMTDRYLPLAQYTMRQNYTTMPEGLYPDTELVRSSINAIPSASGSNVKTVAEMLDMEAPLAKGNPEVQEQALEEIPALMKNSLTSTVQTKVLESNAIDRTDSEAFSLADVLINHWLYFAHKGLLQAVVVVTNPTTGEALELSAKEAFILYLYAYNLPRVGPLDRLPVLEAKRVKHLPGPSRAELERLIDARITSPTFVDVAMADQVVVEPYLSIEAFRNACVKMHAAMVKHHRMAMSQPNDHVRVQVEMMTSRFYCDYGIDLGSDQTYSQWLLERNIDLSHLTKNDADLFAQEVYNTATGTTNVTDTSLRAVQKAMLSIMTEYNSYSIQFVRQVNEGGLIAGNQKMIKPVRHSRRFSTRAISQRRLRILSLKRRLKNRFVALKSPVTVTRFALRSYHRWYVELGFFRKVARKTTFLGGGRTARIRYRFLDPGLIDLGTVLTDVEINGYEDIGQENLSDLFTALQSEQYNLASGPDIGTVVQNDQLPGFWPPQSSLSATFVNTELDGFAGPKGNSLGRTIDNDQLDGFDPQ